MMRALISSQQLSPLRPVLSRPLSHEASTPDLHCCPSHVEGKPPKPSPLDV
jgi:hypothetical protein